MRARAVAHAGGKANGQRNEGYRALAGVVWLAIYAWNECTLEGFVVFAILIIAGALVAARLERRGRRPKAEWHGAANHDSHAGAPSRGRRLQLGGGIAHRLLAAPSWRGPTHLRRRRGGARAFRCARRAPDGARVLSSSR